MSHAPRSFWPVLNGGEHTALFSFIFLYFAAAGPGRFSLDAALVAGRGGASTRSDGARSRTIDGSGADSRAA